MLKSKAINPDKTEDTLDPQDLPTIQAARESLVEALKNKADQLENGTKTYMQIRDMFLTMFNIWRSTSMTN